MDFGFGVSSLGFEVYLLEEEGEHEAKPAENIRRHLPEVRVSLFRGGMYLLWIDSSMVTIYRFLQSDRCLCEYQERDLHFKPAETERILTDNFELESRPHRVKDGTYVRRTSTSPLA